MTQWEYKRVWFDSRAFVDDKLQELGRQGWELCAVTQSCPTGSHAWLKRPIAKPHEEAVYVG